jgi:major intracellular serine protease
MVLFPYQTQDTQAQAEIPWNIQQVNAPSFWQHTKGDGVVVAVVDTGLDVSHPEFAGRIVQGRNFTYDSAADTEGHGTHVAGIIGGATTGIAPGVRIMPLKVFGKADGFQFQDAFRFIRQYNQAAAPDNKIVAVNCSWGGPYDAQLHYMIRQLVADGVGVIVSAGNAGDGDPETSEIFSWPGFLWEPITVGALNQDGQPAGYSSSYDGIDLGAPGTLIYSAWPGGGYKLLSGTSMAAPHVTGAYALLVAAFKNREGRLPTGDEIEGILFKHVRATGVDERLSGAGILDLTYETKRWPLYRVQTGAFFNEAGAIATKEKLVAAGFSAYPVKY